MKIFGWWSLVNCIQKCEHRLSLLAWVFVGLLEGDKSRPSSSTSALASQYAFSAWKVFAQNCSSVHQILSHKPLNLVQPLLLAVLSYIALSVLLSCSLSWQ